MESSLHPSAFAPVKTSAKFTATAFWVVTALFCLQMSFTAYAQLRLPQVADSFAHLGFPAYFLVVGDLISHAREVGIWVGPGRGSAAGCAVTKFP